MEKTLRDAIKYVILGTVVLTVTACVFTAGFGSAYLLARGGVLPMGSAAAAPTATPTEPPATALPPAEVEGEDAPTPTPTARPTPADADEETFQLFWEVWDLVQRNFYGVLPDMQQVTYAAIRGMLGTLGDDYTAFIEPQVAAIIAEDATGEFEGIGAFVGMDEEGKLELVGIFEGGPAEEAGLLEGDRVLEVDGISIVGAALYEAIGLIRGPADSEVTLLIEREEAGEPFEVTVTRARLEIAVIELEMRDDGIGYVRLYDFSATASEKLEEALEELLVQEPRGIVLDLRGNPGGFLDQAVEVSDLFLDDGAILYERWSNGRERAFEADDGDVGEEIPLVVLVNGGSASASEIVAGALQDRERATLIGTPTFGKGSVQQPFTLSDGSELRVTIALWFTPDDQAIHGDGLVPDIEVEWPDEEDLEPGADPQLERAVEYLLMGE
jgi:carboxyl-terminal processing protease